MRPSACRRIACTAGFDDPHQPITHRSLKSLRVARHIGVQGHIANRLDFNPPERFRRASRYVMSA